MSARGGDARAVSQPELAAATGDGPQRRALVTGASGMLGTEVCRLLAEAPGAWQVTALGRVDLDITDADAAARAVATHDVVVNCAAYTAVDAAESDEDAAYAVNALGPQNLARAAQRAAIPLIHVSTDYVFDGTATEPYAEETPRCPVSAYGRTKAAGEALAFAEHPDGTRIVRTAWLYGEHGPNFAKTMLALATTKLTWAVVGDQTGQPTWARDVAARIVTMVTDPVPPGVYHATNTGSTTWCGFARAVLAECGLDPERITETTTDAFPRPALRPRYSVLGDRAAARVGLLPLRTWQAALHAAVAAGSVTLPPRPI